MNQTFRTSRLNNRQYILRKMLFLVAIVAVLPILIKIIGLRPLSQTSYIIIWVTGIYTLLREAFRDRIIEIEFNSDTGQIIFHYEKLFSKKKQKILLIKNARLEIHTDYSRQDKNLVIYFLSAKVEYFKVGKNKDGFTHETLAGIRDFANKLSLPVSKY